VHLPQICRNPPNFPYDRHYETNGWFYVEDSVKNLMKNRYVITMPYMGMPVRTQGGRGTCPRCTGATEGSTTCIYNTYGILYGMLHVL